MSLCLMNACMHACCGSTVVAHMTCADSQMTSHVKSTPHDAAMAAAGQKEKSGKALRKLLSGRVRKVTRANALRYP